MRRLLFLLLALVSCAFMSPFDGYDPSTDKYAVRGRVDGLDGNETVTLVLNGGQSLTKGNGDFAFENAVTNGDSYELTVVPQATIACGLEHSAGTIKHSDATDVAVHCTSNSSGLIALTVSEAPLVPAFSPAALTYTARRKVSAFFPHPASAVVTATVARASATLSINGVAVASGTPSGPISLKPGANIVDIVVKAPNGIDTSHYALTIRGEIDDYLKGSKTETSAGFGVGLAVSGDTLVVGAPGETEGTFKRAGAVHVFVRDKSGNWSEQMRLKSPAPRALGTFGRTLDVSGDTLAITEQGDTQGGDGGAPLAGTVHVFVRTGTTWTLQTSVQGTDGGTFFGVGLSLKGDDLAVGDPSESTGQTPADFVPFSGAAYLFHRDGTTWTETAKFKARHPYGGNLFTGSPNDSFGGTLALSQDTLAIAAAFEQSSATGLDGNPFARPTFGSTAAGAVYIYHRVGGVWSIQNYVKSGVYDGQMYFGYSLALADDTLLVGAPGDTHTSTGEAAPGAGSVHVYANVSGQWTDQALLLAKTPTWFSLFGYDLSLSKDTLVVAAPYESGGSSGLDPGSGSSGQLGKDSIVESGAVNIFTRTGSTFSQVHYLKSSNPSKHAQFGFRVVATPDTIAVSSPGENSNATGINGDRSSTAAPGSGAVFVY